MSGRFGRQVCRLHRKSDEQPKTTRDRGRLFSIIQHVRERMKRRPALEALSGSINLFQEASCVRDQDPFRAAGRRELPRHREERRSPDPRSSHERAQEVRSQSGPPRSAVQQALISSRNHQKTLESQRFLGFSLLRGLTRFVFSIPFYTG